MERSGSVPWQSLRMAEVTAGSTLADTLELGAVDEDDLYAAMDWLLGRQERIERALATGHLADGRSVHSLQTLLQYLATVTRNRAAPRLPGTEPFDMVTRPPDCNAKPFGCSVFGSHSVPRNKPPQITVFEKNTIC